METMNVFYMVLTEFLYTIFTSIGAWGSVVVKVLRY